MKKQKILINGLKHQFYFWGSPQKPKLFLFHGWLDTAASFDFLCRYLEKDFYCIAPDWRGYGHSEHTKSALGYFFFEYVADVHAILNHFSPKAPARVLGHSLGGAITSFYAGSFPERVSHFMNLEGFGFRDNIADRAPEKARKWVEELHSKRFQEFDSLDAFAKRLRQNNPRLPLARALFLSQYLTREVKKGRKSVVTMAADPKHKLSDPYALSQDYHYAFWRKIQAKCLLIWAEKTEMNHWVQSNSLSSQMKKWFRQFPKGSSVAEIKGCGHMMHHEKPEALAPLIIDFLR